jgi:flagellin-like hook-associated protein FlgL
MERLTISQIQDYNNRNAFTRARSGTGLTAATFLDSVKQAPDYKRFQTDGIQRSYSILNGIAERMDMIRANLGTMLAYSRQGAAASSSLARDEAIGLLRSLSGGIDDIVDNTVFSGTKVLDGRPIELSMTAAGGGPTERLNLRSYYSGDSDGLALTDQPASSKSTVFYDYYAMFRNSSAGVVGLDISDAISSPVTKGRKELDNGQYRLEISYAGPDSAISIKSPTGGLINTIRGVDLSGSGQELVDLEVGVTLSIKKEQILQSIDKYDYETNGPAKLYAMILHEQTYEHQLKQDGFQQFTNQSLQVNFQRKLSGVDGGELRFDAIKATPVKEGTLGLASGLYSVSVNYNGASSSVVVKGTDESLPT